MSNQIQEALFKRFEKQRIIFWYDVNHEFRKDFETLELPEVEKVEIANNEFSLKYRLLREQPQQKFLLYKEGPEPEYRANWLLDVQLSHDEFRTDQSSLWLAELELPIDYRDVVEGHKAFFEAKSRLAGLKKLLEAHDSRQDIELKMMAVCAGTEARLDMILEALLQEHADHKEAKAKLLSRCELDSHLWKRVERGYGYSSETPGIKDFVIELFKSCYAMGINSGESRLSDQALVFLRRWRDNRNNKEAFEILSSSCAEVLHMEQQLEQQDFRDLMELDYFRLITRKIIRDLATAVYERKVSSGEVSNWVRLRRQSFWYEEYQHLYGAIDHGARFIGLLDKADLTISSLNNGIERYCENWHKIDHAYRKFVWHNRQANLVSLMQGLAASIDNLYSNNYLLTVNNAWQQHVDTAEQWDASPISNQRRFYAERVMPFVRKEKKVCVIISDALRFEIGHELLGRIRREDRFDADLTPALSTLPSYTQLGMAALLPHKCLTIGQDSTVKVDGVSSRGTENRDKILKTALKGKARAIQAKDLLAMNRDESRELTRNNEVIYVYHNIIDKTGDSRDTQERVFKEAETAIEEVLQLVKKLTNANASNLLITSDHGFIYQDHKLEESDFAGAEPNGDKVFYRDRRFELGTGLKHHSSLKTWSTEQLKLEGDLEVQIPKSINRLRLQGSGSQFVHGGASLQEVVIPIIQINKKRKSDISAVEVEILRGSTNMITTGQLPVRLYQCEAVTDKIQPRFLRVGIYSQAGELISDLKELPFDMTSEQSRDRELQIQLVLSHEADKANNQEVILRLDEKLAGTSHYQEYKTTRYQLRRSFSSDFDF